MKELKVIILGFFVLCTLSCVHSKEEPKKPNIIFLFADDECYHTVNALGNKEVKTPNLDKLCHGGVTFTHAYNMGSWSPAVCLASRAMINTGRYVWNAREAIRNGNTIVEQEQTWSQMMQQAGYETYLTGKWHVKYPAEKVFNHVKNERHGMPKDSWNGKIAKIISEAKEAGKDFRPYMPHGYNRPLHENDTSWLPWDKSEGGFWEGGTHWSEVLANDAIGFIEDAKGREKPYFMYLAFNACHDPRQSPKEYIDMYPIDKIAVPESFMPKYEYEDSIGCGSSLRDEALAPFPRTEYAIKVHRQEYYSLITHMDAQIGRILTALEESGELDNTYIFYTADHGLAIGNHGLIGKQNLYDHSVRVPLFVLGPDVPKNKRIEADVYLQDIMASTLDLAKYEKPKYIDFNSLMPLVKGDKHESYYPAVYGCFQDLQRSIRDQAYKLILYPKGKTVLLYNLEKDPHEMHNLADNTEFDAIKKDLFNQLLELQKEMNDPLDIASIFTDI